MDGSRINASLAVHLFGWIYRETFSIPQLAGPGWQDQSGDVWLELPDWAGTWDGMQLVIEAMRERGEYVVMDNSEGRWWVSFPATYPHIGIAEMAPEAVALAALKVLGVTQEGGDANWLTTRSSNG